MLYADAYYRNGKLIDHKASADIAVQTAAAEGLTIDKVLVWRRRDGEDLSNTPMVPGRDFYMEELLKNYRRAKVEPVSVDAEHPLFLMYTSGEPADYVVPGQAASAAAGH